MIPNGHVISSTFQNSTFTCHSIFSPLENLKSHFKMLDFFVLFSKGGIVLWCCQGSKDIILTSVNALIRSVILEERSTTYQLGPLQLKYKLDNEFELVFVAGYQAILKLSYVDKFLDEIQLRIRDKYKNELLDRAFCANGLEMETLYKSVLTDCQSIPTAPKIMKTFEESKKSKKNVGSMIIKEDEKKIEKVEKIVVNDENIMPQSPPKGKKKVMGKFVPKSPKQQVQAPQAKKGKEARQWELGGNNKDLEHLDRTNKDELNQEKEIVLDKSMLGKMTGSIQAIEVVEPKQTSAITNLFKGLVSGKTLTNADVGPALEKLRDHLIGKNVAAEVAAKLIEAVGSKLEGKVLGTFQTVNTTVKSALEESLLALLQPKRQVDVLREALESKSKGKPFVITFCGVNGVGKSTNLAKICFWLIENNLHVLVAACDTFRAGAVEQLRTHARHLNALHPATGAMPFVQLYEKGYGKDAAGVAAEAIGFARDNRIDVVLVDTAGRMQNNEPLMRALTKLIRVNNPDLVLFVGEALVGNESVDQLVKFNRAMADFSEEIEPRLIDGIVLSKFDTVDDKVGAAVSMTYTTGQPIVFVGTGQTYTDLKALDSRAVVNALMK